MSERIKKSSGNVFADLGVRNPEEALVKAQLAQAISLTIDARGLTQTQAAELLGVDQPNVSRLVRGQLAGFSIDRLFRFLNLLGSDIEIVVKGNGDEDHHAGHIKVALA